MYDTRSDMWGLSDVKFHNQIFLFEKKAEIEIKKQEKILQQRIQLKENQSRCSLAKDEEGDIVIRTKLSEDVEQVTKVAHFVEFATYNIHPLGEEREMQILAIIAKDEKINMEILALIDENLTSKKLFKLCQQAGMRFFVAGKKLKIVLDLFLAEMIRHASYTVAPMDCGFFRSDEGWNFAGKETLTWREAKKRARW